MIAIAFAAIVWSYFFADDLGVVNYYLRLFGLPGVRWLTDSFGGHDVDHHHGRLEEYRFFMIIFIAALQGVPKSLMEAAAMDGTPAWRRFFRITLPYISPVVFFAIVYASIGARRSTNPSSS